MIEDVVGGIFKVLGRMVGHLLVELVFEVLIKGTGYLICKPFCKEVPDPEGFAVVLIGLAFWVAVGAGAFFLVWCCVLDGTNKSDGFLARMRRKPQQ